MAGGECRRAIAGKPADPGGAAGPRLIDDSHFEKALQGFHSSEEPCISRMSPENVNSDSHGVPPVSVAPCLKLVFFGKRGDIQTRHGVAERS